MGTEAVLQSACELSYDVAREGVEAEPPIDPPDAMRSFLYVSELPTRALTVAREAIEDDPAFRRLVAERASENDVGRAGYLWLHRPIGWAAEFEELSDDAASGPSTALEAVPALGSVGNVDDIEDAEEVDEYGVPVGAVSESLGFGSIDTYSNGDNGLELSLAAHRAGRSEANAIEDELSSLRGLVDRLSNERKAVSSSARRVEQELEVSRAEPSVFDTDIYTLKSELEAARADLAEAKSERDNAVRQHSESLTRQLELERELERSRELRAQIELDHAESDAGMVELRESLARTEASLAGLQNERDDLSSQTVTLTAENVRLNTELSRVTEENASRVKALEGEYAALKGEAGSLEVDNESLTARLTDLQTDYDETASELGQISAQAQEAKALVDALTEEKIDLASRLADTEAMLETTRVQLGAVKTDADAVAADLASVRAHRDGLSDQVDELHGSLTEALNDLAKVRAVSDADRASLKELRSERDGLRVRVSSLEQVESGLDAKLEALTSEHESMVSVTNSLRADLTEREREVRDLTADKASLVDELTGVKSARDALLTERDTMATDLERVRAQLAELGVTRDGLNQQVQQLTDENSVLQAQLVESDRLRHEASENQGHALSELAHRLSLVENERTRFETELRDTEAKLVEALVALEEAAEAAEEANRRSALDVELPASLTRETPALESGSTATTSSEPVGAEADQPRVLASPDIDEPEPVADAEADTGKRVLTDAAESTLPPPPSRADRTTGEVLTDVEAGIEDVKKKEGRASKRQWGFGPLLRGDAQARKSDEDDAEPSPDIASPDNVSQDAGPQEPTSNDVATSDDNSEAEEVTALDDAEPEHATGASVSVADDAVDDDDDLDLDDLSSELAQAAGSVELPADAGDDEDLDEISNLISQTVTDFDPSTLERPNFGEPDDMPGRAAGGSAPPSIFATGEVPVTDDADDRDKTSAMATGPARPEKLSVAGGEPDDDTDAAPAKGGRRRIEIPADVADDEIEVARHVVASPDVVLLVDGDSVAKMGWPSLPVAQQRDALVSYLADLSSTTQAAPDVVFDGRIGEEESLPANRAVRIRLSTPPTEPAAALDELVDAYPEQWPIAVVTDEEELTRSAIERGAVVLNNGQLLDLFIAE